MAKQITHISVFLASPSDLNEERAVVKNVIDELNSIVRQTLNVHLDLLTWENNAYPSVGIDAQDVINKQLGDEYDIFIGMMWKKFGTPTHRAGSGTEEEFNRAYEKFVQTKGETKIMVYFSAKPVQLDEIDVEQLGKIKEFKKRAQDLGVLHWSFNDADSFQKLLKMHLLSHVRDVKNSLEASHNNLTEQKDYKAAGDVVALNITNIEKDEDDAELGYLDLMENFHENFAQVEKILVKIGEHVEDLGEQMSRKAQKLDAINKSPSKSPHSYRAVIDSSAADISNYVQLTNVELPRFRDLFTTAIDSFSNGLALVESEGGGMGAVDLEELLEAIDGAKNNVQGAVDSVIGFRDVIVSWPSVAKTLNKAVRLLLVTLSDLIGELTNSVLLLDQLKLTVKAILSRKRDGESGVEEI
jgi:hypothetical protein